MADQKTVQQWSEAFGESFAVTNFGVISYEEAVKKTLIVHFVQTFLNHLPADELVDTLDIIFRRKRKVIRNLALYVQTEVEQKGHPIEVTLSNIGFFAMVLKDYATRNNGHPKLPQ